MRFKEKVAPLLNSRNFVDIDLRKGIIALFNPIRVFNRLEHQVVVEFLK
jgi:hypothetical protein